MNDLAQNLSVFQYSWQEKGSVGIPNEFQLSFEILVYSLRWQKPFCLSDLIKNINNCNPMDVYVDLSVVLYKISLYQIWKKRKMSLLHFMKSFSSHLDFCDHVSITFFDIFIFEASWLVSFFCFLYKGSLAVSVAN